MNDILMNAGVNFLLKIKKSIDSRGGGKRIWKKGYGVRGVTCLRSKGFSAAKGAEW
jgi:hypothetical protein